MSNSPERPREVIREAVVIGHQSINGVPYVNGKRAIPDPDPVFDVFSPWRCPECGAHLVKSGDSQLHLCLNLCGLPHAWAKRFTEAVSEVQHAQRHLTELKEAAARGEVDAVDVLAQVAKVKEVGDRYAKWLKRGGM